MSKDTPAIDTDRLTELLTGKLSEEEQAELLERLERSAADRQSLEQLAATPDLWTKVAELLKGMPSLPNRETAARDDAPSAPQLNFLRPSSHADCIGELGDIESWGMLAPAGWGLCSRRLIPCSIGWLR
jgi:hypothetical protein